MVNPKLVLAAKVVNTVAVDVAVLHVGCILIIEGYI
jgi:hypothetical protein